MSLFYFIIHCIIAARDYNILNQNSGIGLKEDFFKLFIETSKLQYIHFGAPMQTSSFWFNFPGLGLLVLIASQIQRWC